MQNARSSTVTNNNASMDYYLLPRQGKENTIARFLTKCGHKRIHTKKKSDFALTHSDLNIWKQKLLHYPRPILMYPHALDSWQNYDLGGKPWDRIACCMVASKRCKEILEILGYDRPIEIIGFPYISCVKPLAPNSGKRILFAPIHTIQGQIDPLKKKRNEQVFHRLAELVGEYSITVYHHYPPETCGIPIIDGIKYIASNLSVTRAINMINAHDIIIAKQTFLQLAVALGKPAISFGEEDPFHPNGMECRIMDHPELMTFWKYPVDLLECTSFHDALKYCNTHSIIDDWKINVLGTSLELEKIQRVINEYVS